MLKTYYIKFYTTDNHVSAKEIEAYSFYDAKSILESMVDVKCIITWELRD